MQLTYKCISGQPSNVTASLSRSLSQFERYYSQVKIGITSNPERRANEHAQQGWQRMVVKYKTSSLRNANTVEKYFINGREELKNKWTGFSPLSGHGPYYTYIIMK